MSTQAGAFTCIVCPNGCRLEARLEAGPEGGPGGFAVRGNQCKRGDAFARTELTNPVRTLTTTVRTVFPWAPVLPVRTDGEIPKGKIGELMAFLRGLVVRQPLGIGDAVTENVLGLGRNIIATSNILAAPEAPEGGSIAGSGGLSPFGAPEEDSLRGAEGSRT